MVTFLKLITCRSAFVSNAQIEVPLEPLYTFNQTIMFERLNTTMLSKKSMKNLEIGFFFKVTYIFRISEKKFYVIFQWIWSGYFGHSAKWVQFHLEVEEGLKIWWVGKEVFNIDGTYRFCFQSDQDWKEEGWGWGKLPLQVRRS